MRAGRCAAPRRAAARATDRYAWLCRAARRSAAQRGSQRAARAGSGGNGRWLQEAHLDLAAGNHDLHRLLERLGHGRGLRRRLVAPADGAVRQRAQLRLGGLRRAGRNDAVSVLPYCIKRSVGRWLPALCAGTPPDAGMNGMQRHA